MTPEPPAGRSGAPAGAPSAPDRVRVLTLVTLAAALAAAVAGFAMPARLPPDDPVPWLARFGIAVGVLAIAQLARLRFRVGSGSVSVTWGEAALIIGLYLVPAGWLPAAALLGVGLGWSLLTIFSDRRPLLDVVHVTASLAAAVALATAVSTAFGAPFGAGLTPPLAGALALGALTYLLVSAWLAALTIALRHGSRPGPLLLRALRGKSLMFVGNVLVGLAVVAVVERDPRWLLLLPPALWLLQQTYSHRLRADDERRAWRALAEAIGALNQLNEHAVATAGVTGALEIFGAERAEVAAVGGDDRWRRYLGEPGSEVVHRELPEGERPELAASPTDRPDHAEPVLTRPLVVGAARVGELRVQFPTSAPPGRRERDAMSAFGDALAGALHDAVTHRELRRVTARSSYDAVHDTLTNLVNRAALLSRGDLALHRLGHEHPVALLLLDINHFKEVNDTLGHAAGDELLQVTADRLDALTRPGELLGRLGGDEFALLIPSPGVLTGAGALGDHRSPMAQVLRRAREIVEILANPIEVAGVRMSVEVSVGVVVAGAGTADMTELLRRADIAMYQAKQGGGSIASYDSARDEASTDKLALLAELREALGVDDQLELALQPAVDLCTGEPTGVEALIRWRHPRRGRLSPAEFVRAIEGSELLGAFTRYVVDKALAVAADWARHGLDVPISINVSARSLLDPRLPAEVAESLRRHQVPAHRLVLEITETVVMSELEVIDEVLAALRSMGVQLAVDDFGTGFSSLTFLTRIEVDELKVDRSFVMKMAESPEAAAIVRTTVDLGRELGLRVVAEGVETADQRAALAELGCTAAQGYHFFRPMPSDKIVAVLRSLLDTAQVRIFPLRADGAS
ncbi:putative bifunctional diguanylate cyclase/phosphodiesterase [Plantactinospora sp. CA-290183]|uniref:putative bifunctional diguanylate cyclase/phosphodiesterase n=1 Tax=Plantactinospora sp. CA-290183 TaxID=3240006 RepID=UPI003D90B6D6